MKAFARVTVLLGISLGLSFGGARAAPGRVSLVFTVNSAADAVDDDPGNGTCETAHCAVTGPDTPSLLGVTATGVGPLGNYGGPTLTVRLSAGSTAVEAANPLGCTDEFAAPLVGDQRGYVARAMDGDGNGNAICDIGAFELGAASPFTWLPLLRR